MTFNLTTNRLEFLAYITANQGCKICYDGDFVEVTLPDVPPIVLISDVSPRQIRQALNYFNLRDAVEASVAASSQDIKDWWEYATVVERTNPMIDAMASQLGITTEQVDAVFIYATMI